jgi:hypothetical protein
MMVNETDAESGVADFQFEPNIFTNYASGHVVDVLLNEKSSKDSGRIIIRHFMRHKFILTIFEFPLEQTANN